MLGTIHVLDCALIYLTVAITARRILSARPHASQIVARLSGVVMIAIAITLTFERALA